MRNPDQRKFVSENMRNFFKDSMVRTEVSTVTRVLDMGLELVSDPGDMFDPVAINEIRFALQVDVKTQFHWSDYEYRPIDFQNFKRGWESLSAYYKQDGIEIAPVVDARELKYTSAFDYHMIFLSQKLKDMSHLSCMTYGNFCDMYPEDVVNTVNLINIYMTGWRPTKPDHPVVSISGRRLFKYSIDKNTCAEDFKAAKNQINSMVHEPVEEWRVRSWLNMARKKNESNQLMSHRMATLCELLRRRNMPFDWFREVDDVISMYDVAIKRYENHWPSLLHKVSESKKFGRSTDVTYLLNSYLNELYFPNNRLVRSKSTPDMDIEKLHKTKDIIGDGSANVEKIRTKEEKARKRLASKMETIHYANAKRKAEAEKKESLENSKTGNGPEYIPFGMPTAPTPVRVAAGSSRITEETIVREDKTQGAADPVVTIGEHEQSPAPISSNSQKDKPLVKIAERKFDKEDLEEPVEKGFIRAPAIVISDPFADFSLSLTDKEYENLNSSPDFSEYLE